MPGASPRHPISEKTLPITKMPIQEQEERDFFPQSEMQMCVKEAKHARYVRNQQVTAETKYTHTPKYRT